MLKGTEQFTSLENQGKSIFFDKCSGCHSGINFTDYTFRNNGVSIKGEKDKGRSIVTLDVNDSYKFKVPTLRNIEYSSPYMHDGRFKTLQEVLNFYSDGVHSHNNVDSLVKQANGNVGIPLSTNEKQALIAFLLTLSDHSFINNPAFSE